MPLADVPFVWRLTALVGFLAVVSLFELAIRGRDAVRWRGAIVLTACGAVGAVLGVAVDSVTSWLGPAYFAVGKGLGDAPGLTVRAISLGARAGTSAGVVIGCVLILAARRAPTATELCGAALRIGASAVAGGAVGLVAGALLPAGLVTESGFTVPMPARRGFLVAWTTHAGVYTGAIVGAVRAAVTLRRARDGGGVRGTEAPTGTARPAPRTRSRNPMP